MRFARSTLGATVEIEGLGLHSGTPVRVRIHPGQDGIAFHSGASRWAAIPENVTDTTRSTRLGDVGTVEHLMSALAGLEITDAEVEVEGPEMPGLDGSALPYVRAIATAGRTSLGESEIPALFTRIFLQEEDGASAAIAKGSGHWRYVFSTGDRWPGEQVFETPDAVAEYAEMIAPARTFAFSEELETLIRLGLGQGLDATSALILGDAGYQNEARFPDEPARHKLLDLIGDLYLAGLPLRALSVVAQRTGHRANVKLAGMLVKALGSIGSRA